LGKFLVFEGIDGSGKSTCVKFASEYLKERGKTVKTYHEPNTLRDVIIQVLKSNKDNEKLPEIAGMLFTADRLINQENLKYWIKEYDFVLYDRYYMSTLAYQGAMGADISFLHRLQEFVIRPDFTLFINVSPDEALKRRELRGLPEEPLEKYELQQRVYEQFKLLLPSKRKISTINNIELEQTKQDIVHFLSNFID
jgi:dTMP kinase